MAIKICSKCGLEKDESEFHGSGYKKKDGTQSLHSWCKVCVANKPSYQKEYWSRPENKARKKRNAHKSYLNNKEKINHYNLEKNLKRKYGITFKEYNVMLDQQHGVCKICGKAPIVKRLHVDHDHKTGTVRALLCTQCNMMLGATRDNPTILRLAALYLEEHGCE